MTELTSRDRQVGGDYYSMCTIQPWDIVIEYNLSFFLGSAIKYQLRNKDPKKRIEDLHKAIHCIEKEIEVLMK